MPHAIVGGGLKKRRNYQTLIFFFFLVKNSLLVFHKGEFQTSFRLSCFVHHLAQKFSQRNCAIRFKIVFYALRIVFDTGYTSAFAHEKPQDARFHFYCIENL